MISLNKKGVGGIISKSFIYAILCRQKTFDKKFSEKDLIRPYLVYTEKALILDFFWLLFQVQNPMRISSSDTHQIEYKQMTLQIAPPLYQLQYERKTRCYWVDFSFINPSAYRNFNQQIIISFPMLYMFFFYPPYYHTY